MRILNDRQKEINKEWKRNNPLKVKEYTGRYRAKYPGRAVMMVQRRKLEIKKECIAYYSNGSNKCACCGDANFEFLAVDHINGGGKKEFRERGNGNIHQWLKNKGYPEGYRILCHNCNMSLGFYGYCPHGNIERSY